jgi:hypothetical protein
MEPHVDHVLRDEAAFANEDYRPHADQLAINPDMFRRYHSPSQMWDWRQRSASLLGNVAGKELLAAVLAQAPRLKRFAGGVVIAIRTAAAVVAILLCAAGTARASSAHDASLSPAAQAAPVPGARAVWSETTQMALFGAGLSGLAFRLGKRKA